MVVVVVSTAGGVVVVTGSGGEVVVVEATGAAVVVLEGGTVVVEGSAGANGTGSWGDAIAAGVLGAAGVAAIR